jgi:hypothetical protein
VDAEGCFQIRPLNGGANWSCVFGIAVRDDDTELLLDLREMTGLGNVTRVAAVRNSKPQVLWSIETRAECLWLAELLEQFPLRGRKRRELAVWAEAVRALDRGAWDRVLPQLVGQLRALRRYVNPPVGGARADVPLDEDLVAYLGGFFTGEGHLAVHGTRARAVVRLREDDRPLLEDLASATGLGKLYSYPRAGRSGPSTTWAIFRRDQLLAAADLLGRAGLRGRKAKELPVWRAAVLELTSAMVQRRRARADVVSAFREELLEARRYRPGPDFPIRTRRERLQERYVHALRAAATATTGPLTVGAYDALRRDNPLWPNRNTVARAFGGWAEALAAAGLADRAGCRRGPTRRDPNEYSPWQLEQRLAERQRTIEVVARLMAANASPPTVHEYLAWRIAHDKSLPCLAKVYDLFPAGWSSVKTLAWATRALADKVPRIAALDGTLTTATSADGWTSLHMALPLKA